MYKLKINEPYPSPVRLPEGQEYNWRESGHELFLCYSQVQREEIEAITTGTVHLALHCYGDVLFFIYAFSSPQNPEKLGISWSDCPYSWWLVSEYQRYQLPPEVKSNTGAILQIVLVEAETNVVKGIRLIVMPHDFTTTLHAAIRAQASSPFPMTYNAQISTAYQQYPTSHDFLKRSIARCVIVPRNHF